jgi:hypothetical protein
LTSAQVSATFTNNVKLLVDTDASNPLIVGNRLAQSTFVHLFGMVAGPSGVNVLVQSNSPLFKVAALSTDPGSSSVTVKVAAGSTIASFWVFGAANSGTGTYTVSAAGFVPATGNVELAPSGIVMLATSTTPALSQGSVGIALFTAALTGTGTVLAFESVAGPNNVVASVSSTNTSVATVPATVAIPAVDGTTTFSATLKATGSATIKLGTPPAGFTAPTLSLSQSTLNVH